MSLIRFLLCFLVFLGVTGGVFCVVALAQSQAGVSGSVLSSDGHAIAGAIVTFSGAGSARSRTSDAHGRFEMTGLPAGTYTAHVWAKGYTAIDGETVAVRSDGSTTVEFRLEREQASSLVTIGHVYANGNATLSTTAVPSINLNAQVLAAQGVTRVSDVLSDQLSTTVYPILGGGLNAPAVVALRGPDPSETLVDVDGHQVNNGSTGDFDLSLLDPADLQNIQVVYGIAPSSLYGPNTLGGALNVDTLEPTTTPHTLERVSYGSYDTFQGTLQATGTDQRFGYAFSFHRMTSGGELNDVPFNNTTDPTTLLSTGFSPIGNDMEAESTIAKLRYSFGNGGFVGVTFRNQAVYRDLSATLSSEGAAANTPPYSNFSGSSVNSNNDAYGLDLDLPLGPRNAEGYALTTAIFRHQTSLESQVVNGGAAGSSPYLYNDRDAITDDTLEVDHQLPHGTLSVKGAITNESLNTDNIIGVIYADSVNRSTAQNATRTSYLSDLEEPLDSVTVTNPTATIQQLGQTQRWIGARYTLDPTAKLHYSLASYYSDYTTFGHSTDPRFGFVWTPTASSSLRFSVGTTFQSPQLPTFIVPAPGQGIPVVDGYAAIGNPDATAEHSTEYDLGYEHLFNFANHPIHSSLDLYRSDLHNGVADYFGTSTCKVFDYVVNGVGYVTQPSAEAQGCLTYPVNVTREVYEGVEFRNTVSLAAKTSLHLDYDIDSVYTKDYPANSADNTPLYEQSIGVPLHKISIDIERDPSSRLSYYAGLLYEGEYNELDLPPYATLRAGVSLRVRDFNITLAGENLTNVYDFKYTRENGGIAYGGLPDLITPPAYPLAGRQLTFIITHQI